MNHALEQFLIAAKQLADVARFDLIRLGIVATNSEPQTLIALSARLIRSATASPLLPDISVGPISAFQYHVPIERLNSLALQLSQGKLQQIPTPKNSTGELLSPFLVPRQESGGDWHYDRNAYDESGVYCCRVSVSGPRLKDLFNLQELTDARIARESRYTYSSFSRIIKAFTGLSFGRAEWNHQASLLELVAPWPLRSLVATLQGVLLRVEVEGIQDLDPSQFILNVEGTRADRRFDASELRWQSAPAAQADKATYTTSFDGRDISPTAVNLYIAEAPEVSLRTEVQVQQAPLGSMTDAASFLSLMGGGHPSVRSEARRVEAPEGTRLTRLRVSGFRLLQSVELDLTHPFAVVVGPNQSGKSSLLEALQLLSEAARGELSEALVRRRGGLGSILTRGGRSTVVTLEVDLGSPHSPPLRYLLSVTPVGAYDFAVADERLSQHVNGQWEPLLTRRGPQAFLAGLSLAVPNERESMLSQLGLAYPVIEAVRTSLAAIAIYPYFRTGAAWADPEAVPMRRPVRLEPGARLGRSGDNLAAALFSLRDERPPDWEEYLGIVRLAFPNLKDLRMPAVSRGTVQLFWDDTSGQSFDASELSDGTLSFLSILCAIFQPGSALIAVDEPEQHLHPDALRRLVGAARSLSDRQPILFTTQSDALIGLLDEAPESVVVASRSPEGSVLVRPDLDQLHEWLKSFSLREMRRELEDWSQES